MSYRQLTEIKVKFSSELTWTFLEFAQGVTSTHSIMAAGVVALQEFYKFEEVIPPYASRCEPNPDREKEAACSYDFFFPLWSSMDLILPTATGHSQRIKQLQALLVCTFYTPSMMEKTSNYDHTLCPASEPWLIIPMFFNVVEERWNLKSLLEEQQKEHLCLIVLPGQKSQKVILLQIGLITDLLLAHPLDPRNNRGIPQAARGDQEDNRLGCHLVFFRFWTRTTETIGSQVKLLWLTNWLWRTGSSKGTVNINQTAILLCQGFLWEIKAFNFTSLEKGL